MARPSAALLSSLSLLLMAITAQSVKTRCKAGEVFKTCGTRCPPTCDNQSPICPAVCGPPGCFCKAGTVRNDKGKCVKVKYCCTGNTVYSECGNDCPNTCADINKQDVMCTDHCSAGCFCKPGYVRLTGSKKCVCPKDCPKNSGTY